MDHIFFVHSSFGEHLGCFHVFATVNFAAVNYTDYYRFFLSYADLISCGDIPRIGIASSYG